MFIEQPSFSLEIKQQMNKKKQISVECLFLTRTKQQNIQNTFVQLNCEAKGGSAIMISSMVQFNVSLCAIHPSIFCTGSLKTWRLSQGT